MIVLWLLVFRGVAIEFRNHVASMVWAPFWDAVFSISSALLAIFFGAALGNVVRGVPLDATGYFFEPLWTDFRVAPPNGILDWYTILVGLAAYFALALHGALWVTLKTDGSVRIRALRVACWAWPFAALFTLAISAATFRVQPHVWRHFGESPEGWVFPLLAVSGLMCAGALLHRGTNDGRAFLSSCVYLAGMVASAAFGIYPYVLPASTDPAFALTADNTAAAAHGLRVGLAWWGMGMLLVAGYFVFVYRRSSGRVSAGAAIDRD
jgi:cytochrome d ubiquinol oxidase subunit II